MGEWIAGNGPIAGVFLTHMHVDHVMGIPDIPHHVPIFSGPGEADARDAMNLFLQSTVDSLLADRGALREWQFEADPDGRFEGVIDVFGDGSFFAIHVPGHTPGNTAFLARAVDGDHLIVGDASHTSWGWENCVEPGEFSADGGESAISLKRLRALADDLERPVIHVGHQHHEPLPTSRECE